MRRISLAVLLLALPLLLSACPSEGIIGGDPTPAPDCATYYVDTDGDGLGDAGFPVELCEETAGYVDNADDTEPDCATNDTDECGICAGANASRDCAGVCFGTAWVDGCTDCVGGTTGVTPAWPADWDSDGRPDVCDQCAAGDQDRFIVQWGGVPHYDGAGGPYEVSVELQLDGSVLLRYGDLGAYGASATVGLQDVGGELGQLLAINDAYPLENPNVLLEWPGSGDDPYDATSLEAPLYAWNSIHHVGTTHDLADDEVITIDLPFEFAFFGEGYESLQLSANGLLAFGPGDVPTYDNSPLPNNLLEPALIAALWDDLNPAAGGLVQSYYAEGGSCERDCAGVWGGYAELDGCGQCSAGTTGVIPGGSVDCAGVCDGEAALDDCGVCAGGTTGVEPSDPEACPNLPDITPSAEYLGDTLSIQYIDVEDDDCLIDEGCVAGSGTRKVLRFGTQVGNIGTADLILGVPPGPHFHWDECHGHYHYSDYADYALLDPLTGEEAAFGHKNGFCLLDSGVFDQELADAAGSSCGYYTCSNQGIGLGCMDIYGAGLACQWVDITDTPDGTYELLVTLNPDGNIPELDLSNNSATVTVTVAGDVVTLVP